MTASRSDPVPPSRDVCGAGCQLCAVANCPSEATSKSASPDWQPAPQPNLDKRRCLDPRNLEALSAAEVLAHHLVVYQDHIAEGLGKAGSVALVGAGGQEIEFLTHQPAQFVCFGRPAKRAVQRRRFRRFGFAVELPLFHIPAMIACRRRRYLWENLRTTIYLPRDRE